MSTNKSARANRTAQRLAAQRAEAARQRLATAQRRRRTVLASVGIGVVVLAVAALVIVKVVTGLGGPSSGKEAVPLPAGLYAKVTGVPPATLNTVGTGDAKTPPTPISAPALTDAGKPEVLYVGAEYCPYCAAERWAVTVALSRFGELHGLGQTQSSGDDVFPNTPTLSFHGATYTSSLLSFVPRELQSNQVVDDHYATLDTLTTQQNALLDKYDAAPYVSGNPGSIPFIDIGGKYVVSGASYDPGVLQGSTHAQVAAALSDPTSKIAQAVDGTANYVTAALCSLTGNKPAAVCTSTGVGTASAALSKNQ